MKRVTLVIVLVCSCPQAFCKSDSTHVFFFNAFSLSVNRTDVENSNTEDRSGYGCGIYHIGNTDKAASFIFGFEYNSTRQFLKNTFEGNFEDGVNMTYTISSFSIPIGVRINIKRKKETVFFIEPDISLDNMAINRKGIFNTFLPYQPYQSTEISQSAGSATTLGFSLGLGLSIPISKYKLIIKPDYKFEVASVNSDYNQIFNSYYRLVLEVQFF